MRPDLVFSDSSVSPNFFFTTPAKKPRTECGCQPVTFEIAAKNGKDRNAARITFPNVTLTRPYAKGALTLKPLPKRMVVTDETSSSVITIDGDRTMRYKGLRVRIIGAG